MNQILIKSRKVVNYIQSLENFKLYNYVKNDNSVHLGAVLTDTILQAGLNYKTVVKPRVNKIMRFYPSATCVKSFHKVIKLEGIEKVISWKHSEKISRLENLITFLSNEQINDVDDLHEFLRETDNRKKLLEIKGIGKKSVDYLFKLIGGDTIVVDRHIYSFISLADISAKGYDETKIIVEYAADLLGINRSVLDYSIWKYMSEKENKHPHQMSLTFD